jgi:hypothetical protein
VKSGGQAGGWQPQAELGDSPFKTIWKRYGPNIRSACLSVSRYF